MKMIFPLKIATWPYIYSTSKHDRIDKIFKSFEEFSSIFLDPLRTEHKDLAKVLTRAYVKIRKYDDVVKKYEYHLISLDYDNTSADEQQIHQCLVDCEISHCLFPTWSCSKNAKHFKVFFKIMAKGREDAISVTKFLADVLDKNYSTQDDLSFATYYGAINKKFKKEYCKSYFFESKKDTYQMLKNLGYERPSAKVSTPDIAQDLDDKYILQEIQIATQKVDLDALEKALKIIPYADLGEFSKMEVWHNIGYALKSAKDENNDGYLFCLWDDWAKKNCSEKYNLEEMKLFWDKEEKVTQRRCTLATVYLYESLAKKISVSDTQEEIKKVQSSTKPNIWINLGNLIKIPVPQQAFLIDKILLEDRIGMLIGQGGIGKSSVCLELAKSISSGTTFYNAYASSQASVAIINREDSVQRIHGLIKKISTTSQASEWRNIYILDNINFATKLSGEDSSQENLLELRSHILRLNANLLKKNRPELKLIILDPLYYFLGGDVNNQNDVSAFFTALQILIKDLNMSLLVCHHANKSKSFSGSNVLRDLSRFFWYLRAIKGTENEAIPLYELFVDKNNDTASYFRALTFMRKSNGLLEIVDEEEEEIE